MILSNETFSLRSLRVRLLLLVLVAALPAWGVILYITTEQRRIAIAEIQRNGLRLAEFNAREEGQMFQGTRRLRDPGRGGRRHDPDACLDRSVGSA
jgi:hypothetical protein